MTRPDLVTLSTYTDKVVYENEITMRSLTLNFGIKKKRECPIEWPLSSVKRDHIESWKSVFGLN